MHTLACLSAPTLSAACRADLLWLDGIATVAICVTLIGALALAACLLPRTDAEVAATARAFGWR